MADRLRLAIAQLNLVVGDVDANAARVIAAAREARDRLKADAVVFPELTLTSYPPEDLLLRLRLYERVCLALGRVAAECAGIDVILGYPRRFDGQARNAVSVLRGGRVLATYDKQLLPNYSVFDEKRYFVPGAAPCVVDIGGVPVGLTICEDIWAPEPARAAAAAGARLIVNLNAS
ncbi:MAG TPA: nitrilase-related carbon-nitrogen hydrolase, partial [Acidiferrobacterales bacterium]